MVDLDVPTADRDDGEDQETGADALTRLSARVGQPCPWSTFTVQTPRGWHLYSRVPAAAIANSAGRLAPHIDIRADGGYIVAPGSRIADHGYTVHNAAPRLPCPHGWPAS